MADKIADVLDSIRADLTRLGSPQALEAARRFFKDDEHLEGYGVPAPEIQAIARDVYREIKPWSTPDRNVLAERLWQTGAHECGAIVCYVWRRWGKQFGEPEFRLFTRWLDRYVHNWALCDSISPWLLGAAVANHPSLASELLKWTTSKNRWRRRASAVALVPSARAGKLTPEILKVAEPLLPDPDLMVQKGVGWLLKETYPKQPAKVIRFLRPRRHKTSRLVLRYAAEKMNPQDRALILSD